VWAFIWLRRGGEFYFHRKINPREGRTCDIISNGGKKWPSNGAVNAPFEQNNCCVRLAARRTRSIALYFQDESPSRPSSHWHAPINVQLKGGLKGEFFFRNLDGRVEKSPSDLRGCRIDLAGFSLCTSHVSIAHNKSPDYNRMRILCSLKNAVASNSDSTRAKSACKRDSQTRVTNVSQGL